MSRKTLTIKDSSEEKTGSLHDVTAYRMANVIIDGGTIGRIIAFETGSNFQLNGGTVQNVNIETDGQVYLNESNVINGTVSLYEVNNDHANLILNVKPEKTLRIEVAMTGIGKVACAGEKATLKLENSWFNVSSKTHLYSVTPVIKENVLWMIKSVDDATVTVDSASYTGQAVEPEVKVTFDKSIFITKQDVLTKGTDYEVSCKNNVNAGTGSVVITGIGSYAGTKEVDFTITPKTVSNPTFEGIEKSYSYTGQAIEPEFTLKDGDSVIPANEYNVCCTDNKEVGTATITVTDNEGGNYEVSGTKTFTIKKAILKKEDAVGGVSANPLTDTLDVSKVQLIRTKNTIAGTLKLDDKVTTLQYGTHEYPWVFEPKNANYETLSGTVSILVNDSIHPTVFYQIGTGDKKEVGYTDEFMSFIDINKGAVEVKLTFSDDTDTIKGSGIAKQQYSIANKKFNSPVDVTDWKDYTDGTSIKLDKTGTYFIYIKAEDNAYNSLLANTEGIVLYEDSEVLSANTDYTYNSGKDCEVSFKANGNKLSKITDATGNALKETDYAVDDSATGSITLKASCMDNLKPGEYTYKVFMNPQGISTEKVNLQYTFKVTVSKAQIAVTGAKATNRVYAKDNDKVTVTNVSISGNKSGDDVSVEANNLQGTLSSENAGTYEEVTLPTLNLTGKNADYYKLQQPDGAVKLTEAVNITAKKVAEPTFDGVEKQYTYDGGKEIAPTFTLKDNDIEIPASEYTVKYTNNINAGTATIKVTDNQGGNYEVNGTATFSIVKATLKVEEAIGKVSAKILKDTLDISKVELTRTKTEVEGTLKLNVAKDASLQYGTHEYPWIFEPENKNYNTLTGTVSITVKDTLKPTVAYQIGDGEKKAVGVISEYGTFSDLSKTPVKVTLSFSDDAEAVKGSGIATKQYYIANKKLEDTSKIEDWKDYTDATSIELDNLGKYFIYVKAVDSAGNELLANTEGIVIYQNSVITNENINYTYGANKNSTVFFVENGNTLVKVAELVDGKEYVLTKDKYERDKDNHIVLKASYLDTLKPGKHTYKVTVNPQGVTTNKVNLQYTFKVTVRKAQITVTGAEVKERTYEKDNKKVNVTKINISGNKPDDDVAVDITDLQAELYSENAGTYQEITLPELKLTGENAAYYELKQPDGTVKLTKEVNIVPKEVTAQAFIGVDKQYTYNNGKAIKPDFILKDGDIEIPASEYTVEYKDNINVGSATIKVTDNEGGNYKVNGQATFTIVRATLEMKEAIGEVNAATLKDTLDISEVELTRTKTEIAGELRLDTAKVTTLKYGTYEYPWIFQPRMRIIRNSPEQ